MDKTIIALSLQQKADEMPLHPFLLTKGDVQAYRLEIRIFDGDKEFPYTQAATVRMVFANDKGLITTNDNGSISDTGIAYDVGATEISFPGRVIAAVQLLDVNGKRLTVSRFFYNVLADPLDAGQPLPTVPEVEQLLGYITAVEQALEDVYGGVHISGTYATYEDFIAAHPTGNAGDLYLVDGSVYAWVDSTNEWLNVGLIADVRTQMSITSDGGGLKLVGDEDIPADNKFYGCIGGVKGYYDVTEICLASSYYESGIWTPELKAADTNPTITYKSGRQNGYYSKFGNMIVCNFEITVATISGGSGNVYIDGFPFSPSVLAFTTLGYYNYSAAVDYMGLYFNGSGFFLTTGNIAQRIPATNLGNDFFISGTIIYYIS